MTARELAAQLLRLADEHGDLPVMMMDVEFDVHEPVRSIEVGRQSVPTGDYGARLTPDSVFSLNGRASRDTPTTPTHRRAKGQRSIPNARTRKAMVEARAMSTHRLPQDGES